MNQPSYTEVSSGEVVLSDSEESFPSSESCSDSDSDFEDAMSGSFMLSSSRIDRQSERSSQMLRSSAPIAATMPVPSVCRLHVASVSLQFQHFVLESNSIYMESLALTMRDIVFSVQISSSIQAELSIASIKLEEIVTPTQDNTEERIRRIFSFLSSRTESAVVYASPDLHLDFILRSEVDTSARSNISDKLVLNIKLQPLILSMQPSFLLRWTDRLQRASQVFVVQDSSSSLGVDLHLSLPEATVYLQSDSDLSHQHWKDICAALRLDKQSKHWTEVSFSNNIIKEHLSHPLTGGFMLRCKHLIVELHNGGNDAVDTATGFAHIVKADSVDFSVYVPYLVPPTPIAPSMSSSALLHSLEPRFFRCQLLRASADNSRRFPVEIRRSMANTAKINAMSSTFGANRQSRLNGDEEERLGPAAPVLPLSQILLLSAYHLQAGSTIYIEYIV
jgi:hypothetical protein